ncbi:hypothetical protein TeGR_g798 [Tetraparma gracilis]|uniref:Sulfatase-modifying factor enzyme-like domain-containing protein n=1 Tax=Tetraparma gracilis TaxID=2962635 RepID=A0ABQ6NBV3_9STRA|nr:hypothetical protein TeGR_g798 [Tetraparma gracilis]
MKTALLFGLALTLGYSPPTTSCPTCDWHNFEPHPADHESPLREFTTEAFYIDAHPVSVSDFASFARSNPAYVPTATSFNDSFVFAPLARQQNSCVDLDARHDAVNWWSLVQGVSWNVPFGPPCAASDAGKELYPAALADHPVTHVSVYDAEEFCKWRSPFDEAALPETAGTHETRLPSEGEWETAARGGKKNRVYAWGNKELGADGAYRANYFQGDFPLANSEADGHAGTSPRGAFPPQNGYGLYDMLGNAWEWTRTPWREGGKYDDRESYDLLSPSDRELHQISAPDYAKKGGSYLCELGYCYRYRSGARSFNTVDTTAGNLGFRCARAKK